MSWCTQMSKLNIFFVLFDLILPYPKTLFHYNHHYLSITNKIRVQNKIKLLINKTYKYHEIYISRSVIKYSDLVEYLLCYVFTYSYWTNAVCNLHHITLLTKHTCLSKFTQIICVCSDIYHIFYFI